MQILRITSAKQSLSWRDFCAGLDPALFEFNVGGGGLGEMR